MDSRDIGYDINVIYDFSSMRTRVASEEAFSLITKRGLEFRASPSSVKDMPNSVVVHVKFGNVTTPYLPLYGQTSDLTERLDEIEKRANEYRVAQEIAR